MTFSIVAYDPESGELGGALQSKAIAAGSRCLYAQAGVGAIATQGWTNPSYGPKGLEMLRAGKRSEEVVKSLVSADPKSSLRQLGIVDAQGRAAAYTGRDCIEWAGHIVGEGFTVQGNILVSEETVTAMVSSFESSSGCLSERLLSALEAGLRAGGDRRGQQSAALLVVREDGVWEYDDRYVDLRVDDHPKPIEELRRIYLLYKETVLEQL